MKVTCNLCGKKFKKRGILVHRKSCREKHAPVQGQVIEQNFTALSPHARLIKATNEFYESLYDHQKLEAVASILK